MTSSLKTLVVGQKYRRRDGKLTTINHITGRGINAVAYSEHGNRDAVWAEAPYAGCHSKNVEYACDLVEFIPDVIEPEQLDLFLIEP